MKILMVTNTYLPIVGGLEKSIQSFTKKLHEWGHEVRIVVPQLEGAETDEKDVVRIPAFHQFKQTGFSVALPVFASLAKIIDSFQPDVIHAHHPFLMGEMALRLATRYAKPVVFTYHIMFDQYSHYLPIPSSLSRRFLVELAVGYCNLSTRVIAPSESVRGILRSEGVKSFIDVVPTGVDVQAFANGEREKMRAELGIPNDAWVLGYVGRLAVEKNLEFLTSAVIRFMKKHKNVHFLVAGKGPSEDVIKKLFQESGIQNRLHLLGVVQGKNLADCYHAMDVFVFASKSETQGMVLCEAMAAGIPVVAMDAPGVREVVKNLENGRLLPHEASSEFYSALSWCLNRNPQQWRELKLRARETARVFSTENCTQKALQVYEKAVADTLVPMIKGQNEWRRMMRRLNTEWKIMTNFSRATGLALSEIITSRHLRVCASTTHEVQAYGVGG